MELEKEKIIKFIEDKEFNKAEKLIKSLVTAKNISNASSLEFFFSSLLRIGKHHDIFKHLKLDKVPPRPIDTSFDIGRRFLYTLHLINQRGGHKIVENYLSGIKVNRTLEHRFLGGIYFDLLKFHESVASYEEAYNKMMNEKYISFYHDIIVNNLLYALFYSGDVDKYFYYKNKIEEKYGDKFVRATKSIQGLLYIINKDLVGLKNILKSMNISDNHKDILRACACYLEDDLKGFQENLKLYDIKKKDLMKQQIENPRRYFSGLFYIKCILGASSDVFENCIKFKNFSFPINASQFGSYQVNEEFQFSSLGKTDAKNYINLKTSEYRINGERGIGLSNEILAISSLVRAGSLGMSFEYLAGEIYNDIGYSEMFLIRPRIKQVIHRIKTHFKFKVTTKKYMAYIDPEVISKFRIDYENDITMPGDVSLENICQYFSVTENTARKYLEILKST